MLPVGFGQPVWCNNEAGYRAARVIPNTERDFCLAPPSNDLIDSLFRDTVSPSEAGPGLTVFVACPDFLITFRLRRHQIVLRFSGKGAFVEHLHDVKSSQPNIEASCGVEPLWGIAFQHPSKVLEFAFSRAD
jgi:hypothetical protein